MALMFFLNVVHVLYTIPHIESAVTYRTAGADLRQDRVVGPLCGAGERPKSPLRRFTVSATVYLSF